jgi:hypothetical protein
MIYLILLPLFVSFVLCVLGSQLDTHHDARRARALAELQQLDI